MSPLLTLQVHEQLRQARSAGLCSIECSLDLQRSSTHVEIEDDHWRWQDRSFPYLEKCKDRTVYYWNGTEFLAAARYTDALIKLVPTPWGPPTFEIDGIKMLPSETISPLEDAKRKVMLIAPRGKRILDTCGGLGYFADWCMQEHAELIRSFEKNASVIWLRNLNPWSPRVAPPLYLTHGDIVPELASIADASFDAVLHDPPRFGIAGELYSQDFYDGLARVLRTRGVLFHYTGTPNKLTSGRNVPEEVAARLRRAGFSTKLHGDGVLATKRRTTQS
jgi:predicted methyltransferase